MAVGLTRASELEIRELALQIATQNMELRNTATAVYIDAADKFAAFLREGAKVDEAADAARDAKPGSGKVFE